MRIERHIYGSTSGYQTLAQSSGVTAAEARALESYSVGQSSDMAFFRSLASRPAWIMRTVGRRRVVTRITPGEPDDARRPTIMRVTLLLAAPDWDVALRGNWEPLVGRQDLWQWNGGGGLAALDAAIAEPRPPAVPRGSAEKLLAVISLIERNWPSGSPLVLRETDFTLHEFQLLGMLIPPPARSGYSAVYRSLRADLPASLICLARQASLGAGVESYRPGQAVEHSPYARALLQASFADGRFPDETVQSYRSFGMRSKPMVPMPARPSAPDFVPPNQVIIEQTPRRLLIGLIAACILLPLISGLGTWFIGQRQYRLKQAERDNQHQAALVERDKQHQTALVERNNQHQAALVERDKQHQVEIARALQGFTHAHDENAQLAAVPGVLRALNEMLPAGEYEREKEGLKRFADHDQQQGLIWIDRGKTLEKMQQRARDQGRQALARELGEAIHKVMDDFDEPVMESDAPEMLDMLITAFNSQIADVSEDKTLQLKLPAFDIKDTGSAPTPSSEGINRSENWNDIKKRLQSYSSHIENERSIDLPLQVWKNIEVVLHGNHVSVEVLDELQKTLDKWGRSKNENPPPLRGVMDTVRIIQQARGDAILEAQ